jgi:hypothetical protein
MFNADLTGSNADGYPEIFLAAGGGDACTTGLQGVCSAGTQVCSNGALTCQQTTQSGTEVCDSLDNNCNGLVDEGGVCPACAINVSSQVTIKQGSPRKNRKTGLYEQTVTLKNTGSAITGPIALVLDSLSSNATLANGNGTTSCATPISPYLLVNVGTDAIFSNREQVSVPLEFFNSTNGSVTYSPRVLAGSSR